MLRRYWDFDAWIINLPAMELFRAELTSVDVGFYQYSTSYLKQLESQGLSLDLRGHQSLAQFDDFLAKDKDPRVVFDKANSTRDQDPPCYGSEVYSSRHF